MRTLIAGAFAASVVVLTGPLALAEEPGTPHHTTYNHHDNRHPTICPGPCIRRNLFRLARPLR
jgi:hypothetical protein